MGPVPSNMPVTAISLDLLERGCKENWAMNQMNSKSALTTGSLHF